MVRAGPAAKIAQAQPAPAGPAVVPPVGREPPAAPPPAAAEPALAPAQKTVAPAKPAPPPASGSIWGTIQDWLARSNRDYQGVVIKELSLPTAGQRPDDAIAKKLEETKAEDAARKAADAKRREDEKTLAAQKEAEAKRLSDDERRKKAETAAKPAPAPAPQQQPKPDDAAKIAEELRRTEQQQQDDALRREAQKQAEAKAAETRRAEVAAAAAAEERRRAEEAERSKNRQRTIVLSVEPIRRPEAVGTMYRPELASPAARRRMAEGSRDEDEVLISGTRRHVRLYRTGGAYRGTAVKRWVWRAGGRGCRLAGRVHRPPSRYTVARGDSLWRISDRHYSSGQKWGRIYRANRHRIRDPDLIYPCQRFKVPRRR